MRKYKRKQIMLDQDTITIIEEYQRTQTPIPGFSQALRELIKQKKENPTNATK